MHPQPHPRPDEPQPQPPKPLAIELRSFLTFGLLGLGAGLVLGLLPVLGGGFGVAPIVTAAVGADLGAMFGSLEGRFQAEHAQAAYDQAIAVRVRTHPAGPTHARTSPS